MNGLEVPVSFRWTLALVLAGCASAPEASSELPMPPPATDLAVSVPDLVPDSEVLVLVDGAPAGAEVFLAVSHKAGAGPCPSALQGGCLGIRKPQLLGSVVADGVGHAEHPVAVPAGLTLGDTLWFQAATTAPDAHLSEPVAGYVVPVDARPDFLLTDLNPASLRFDEPVSPRDYLGKVSGWYFGHSS